MRVDLNDMGENVENILDLSVLATSVTLKVKLHKGIEFRNEEAENLSQNNTILTKDFGNVTRNTEITFEYKIKRVKELLLMDDLDLENLKELPF